MENCGPRFTKSCECIRIERILKEDNKTRYFETILFHATLLLIHLYNIPRFLCFFFFVELSKLAAAKLTK